MKRWAVYRLAGGQYRAREESDKEGLVTLVGGESTADAKARAIRLAELFEAERLEMKAERRASK